MANPRWSHEKYGSGAVTDPATHQDPETARQIDRMVDEILDYRAALTRIRDQATPLDIATASPMTLGMRLHNVRTAAIGALGKVRR